MNQLIVVAGGTGDLGGRVINALLARGADVRVIVRKSSDAEKVKKLANLGVSISQVNMANVDDMSKACLGATCVVSTLAGLRDVVIDTQTILLDAAVKAGVPRFIPSDFSLDFTNLEPGENRNLDLRREFHEYLDKVPISATTIFNGPFTDLLTGQMPLILFKFKRVLYWGDADQRMDFTTMDDTAAFTASAALDPSTPRFLRIAGDQISTRQIKTVVSEVTGNTFRLVRAGGLGMLRTISKVAKTVAPGANDLYPAWQGMQYMRDMLEGRAKIALYDNDRYPGMRWTTVRDVLSAHQSADSPTNS
ncbi:MAG: NmrA family NAD(P)-binding protein [Bacteroidetes bacterium]|nr:NmrA family NAD(P)-binding protein [Fibrella sp.]